MGEPEPTDTDVVDEQALYDGVREKIADPGTYSEPPLADRHSALFRDLGLRA